GAVRERQFRGHSRVRWTARAGHVLPVPRALVAPARERRRSTHLRYRGSQGRLLPTGTIMHSVWEKTPLLSLLATHWLNHTLLTVKSRGVRPYCTGIAVRRAFASTHPIKLLTGATTTCG